jgi:hypothetical protein
LLGWGLGGGSGAGGVGKQVAVLLCTADEFVLLGQGLLGMSRNG